MSWLDNYSTTNTFRSMYINGFIDISGGRLQTRSVTDGHLFIAGDTSLNGNLYVGGDISWNPNNLANDSIPSSAIIGGVVGATGPAGPMSSTNNVLYISANQTTSGNYSSSNDTAKTFFTDTTKSNVYCSLANASDFFEIVYHKDYSQSAYENHIGFLLKPGLYMFEYSGGDIQWSTGWLDHNGSSGYAPEVQFMQGQHTKKDIFTIPDGPKMIYALKDIKQESTGSSTSVRIKSFEGGTFNLSITQLKEGIWNNVTPFSGINNGSTFNQWILSTALSASSTQINIPSSVEVASFHSDADLSLNKRLFVGEDVSLNGNLYVGGVISWNPNSLANNSIPSSAVVREVMLLDAVTQGTHINTTSNMYNLEWKIYGSVNFFGSTSANRHTYYHTTLNRHYHCISINLKPGVYKVTLTAEMTEHLNWGFDNNHNGVFLWPNESGTEDGDWNIPDPTIVITTPVLSNTNFHLCLRDVGTFRSINNYDAQVLFERIGTVPNSSGQTDQALGDIRPASGGYSTNQDTTTIQGGILWSSSVTKPTDPNEYLDLNESGTEWIYRIS